MNDVTHNLMEVEEHQKIVSDLEDTINILQKALAEERAFHANMKKTFDMLFNDK